MGGSVEFPDKCVLFHVNIRTQSQGNIVYGTCKGGIGMSGVHSDIDICVL